MAKRKTTKKRVRKNPSAMVVNPRFKDSKKATLLKLINSGRMSARGIANRMRISEGTVRKYAKQLGVKLPKYKGRGKAKKTTKKSTKKTTKKRVVRKPITIPRKGTAYIAPIRKKGKNLVMGRKSKKYTKPIMIIANPMGKNVKQIGISLLWATAGFLGTKILAGTLQSVSRSKLAKKDSEGNVTQEAPSWTGYIAPIAGAGVAGFLGMSKVGKKFIPRRGELAMGAGIAGVGMIVKSMMDAVVEKKPALASNKILKPVYDALGDNSSDEAVIVVPQSALGDYVNATKYAEPTVVDYNPAIPSTIASSLDEYVDGDEIGEYVDGDEIGEYVDANEVGDYADDDAVMDDEINPDVDELEFGDMGYAEEWSDVPEEEFEEFEEPPMI